MKKYKKLDGNKYTFKLNDLEKNFQKYKTKFKNNIDDIKINELILKNITLKKIYDKEEIYYKKFNNIIEKSGYMFLIDDSYIYSIKKFNKALIKKFDKININKKEIEEKLKLNKIKIYLNTSNIVKYLYELKREGNHKKLNKLCLLFPNEFLIANYIYVIKG